MLYDWCLAGWNGSLYDVVWIWVWVICGSGLSGTVNEQHEMFNSVSALVKQRERIGSPASPPPDDFPGLINEREDLTTIRRGPEVMLVQKHSAVLL